MVLAGQLRADTVVRRQRDDATLSRVLEALAPKVKLMRCLSYTVALCVLALATMSCSSGSDTTTDTTSLSSDDSDAGGDAAGDSTEDDATSGGEPDSTEPGSEEPDSDQPGAATDPSVGLDGGTDPVLPGGGFVTVEPNDAGVFEPLCGNEPCACSDGIDNDGDGVTDGFDDECTGPYDNDEGTFSTGIPGDNRDPIWQDCFFDGNSGAGDDGCRYHTDCLTGEADPGNGNNMCEVSQECRDFCAPLTPPGCDCFGCCGVTVDGETIHVLAGEECSTEVIGDESKCPRCTPSEDCSTECGECELCVGKTLEDLPETCFQTPPTEPGEPSDPNDPSDPGEPTEPGEPSDPSEPSSPPNTCSSGVTPCQETADCASGLYCSLGCCRLFISPR